MTSEQRRWPLPVLIVLVILAYLPAMGGPMQFDDHATLAVDPGSRDPDAWWARLTAHVRPLTKLSFVLTHQAGSLTGDPLLAHHLGSLLIHLFAVLVLGLLAQRICQTSTPNLAGNRLPFVAFAAMALFGLHPAATEAVSYLSARSVALGTLLAGASLLFWLDDRRLAAAVAFATAIAARETMIVALPVFALLELARLDRPTPPFSRSRLRAALRAMVPAGVVAAIAGLWLLGHDRYSLLIDLSGRIAANRWADASLSAALLHFAGLTFLLRYPSIDPQVPLDLGLPTRALVAAVTTSLLLLAWRARRQRPEIFLGLAWALLLLVPLYAFRIRHDAIAERHLYPALAALAFAAAVTLARLPRARTIVLAGIIVAMAAVTVSRNADYRSEIALWEAAARSAPDKPRVLNNLGAAFLAERRWTEAEAVLRRALEIDPAHELAAENLRRAREGRQRD